jgi:hypothetical protein
MLNKVTRLVIVSALLVAATPAYSGLATQIFFCQQDDEATDEQVEAIASEWLKAAKGVKGGGQLEAYLRFPIAANAGEHDFAFVLVAPSFEEWGMFTDAYEGSPAQEIDAKFNELADCTQSTIWESFRVK